MYARESTLHQLIDQRRDWGDIFQALELGDRRDVFDAVVRTNHAQFEMMATIGDAICHLDVRLKEIEEGLMARQTAGIELLQHIQTILLGLAGIGLILLYKLFA
jgi:hypothetical protein